MILLADLELGPSANSTRGAVQSRGRQCPNSGQQQFHALSQSRVVRIAANYAAKILEVFFIYFE